LRAVLDRGSQPARRRDHARPCRGRPAARGQTPARGHPRLRSRPAVSSLPLEGLRVLDFTHAAAGPFATMFLADMGADVIKVERPQGDGGRTMGAPMPGFPRRNSEYYLGINRNKRGVVIDLSNPRGAALAVRLAGQSDVVIQNFRPGVMDRLGLGFER